MKSGANSRSSFGFTIVELLVVIVVIAILAAITIVSYTGITNRATIASIQSDLTNASTLLKMDYTTNSTFPATLALANGGRGITPSQTMDSIIYVPDNTSNPSNFCLQYRKGTNTYAVDNNSQPSSGVCLQNIVTNGDFSQGTSGWSVLFSTITATNNILSITGNGTAVTARAGQINSINWVAGKKVYCRANIRVTNSSASSISLQLREVTVGNNSIGTVAQNPPTVNQWYDMSLIGTNISYTGAVVVEIDAAYVDAATANGKTTQVQNALAIDLTTTFGAGNEPTQAQMDTIMTNYPNSWFNIVAKANS